MKQIIITCDTEIGELGHRVSNPFEVFIEGKIKRDEVGFRLINSIAAKYDARVEHFVDIYPCEKYGEKRFADLCNEILDTGHTIGLHTHPSGKYHANKRYMHQYSLGEQTEIIRFGKTKLKEWTGFDTITHRCGGYGVSQETLKALAENDIFIDCSYFRNHPSCLLNSRHCNSPYIEHDVLEVPITTYKKSTTYFVTTIERSVTTKLDFRYGSCVDDILAVIEQAPADSVLVIFLHSFNFLNLPYNLKTKRFGKVSVNQKLIAEYELLLNSIAKLSDCVFSAFDQIDVHKRYPDYSIQIRKESNILSLATNQMKTGFLGRLKKARNV